MRSTELGFNRLNKLSMKKHILWGMAIAACVLPLLTGCSEEMDENLKITPPHSDNASLLRATLEPQNSTRSAFDDNGAFSWLEGDKIQAQIEDGSFPAFELTEASADKSIGEFDLKNATLKADGYAVSPANLGPQLRNGILTVKLPAVYDRTRFIPLDKTPSNMPMMGKVKDGSIGFKNLTAVVRLHVTNIPKAGCKIVVKADQGRLAGTFTVNQEGEFPCLLADDTNESGNQVTITYKDANQQEDKVAQYFYLPLPVNTDSETTYTIDAYNKVNPSPSDRPVLRGTKLKISGAVERNKLYIIDSKELPDYVNEVADPTKAAAKIDNLITEAAGQQIDEEITIKNFSSDFTLPASLPAGSSLRIRILNMVEGDSYTIQQAPANTREETGISATGSYSLTFIFPDGVISTKLVFNDPKAQLALDGTQTTLSNLNITSVANVAVKSGVTVTEMNVTEVTENTITVEGTVEELIYNPSVSEGEETPILNVTIKGDGEVTNHNGNVSVNSESKGEGSDPSKGEWE